jgi:spermidine synthase
VIRARVAALLPAALAAILVATTSTTDARVIYTKRSVYHDILVTDEGDRVCMRFRVHTREVNARQACMLKADHDMLVFESTRMAMGGLMVAPPPKRILIAGLGGGSLARAFRAMLPGVRVDVVEVDEAVVEVARDYFDFAAGGEVRVIVQDARVYVKRAARSGQKYDLIVLNAFDSEYIPEHLMTREFLEECKTILVPDGVLVANTFSQSRLYDSESITYRAAFGPFLNLKRVSGNRIIIARAGGTPTLAELKAGATRWKATLARYGVDADWVVGVASDRPDWRANAPPLTDLYNPATLLQRFRR